MSPVARLAALAGLCAWLTAPAWAHSPGAWPPVSPLPTTQPAAVGDVAAAPATAPSAVLAAAPSAAAATVPSAAPARPAASAKAPPGEDDGQVQPTLRDDKDVIAASERWLELLDAGQFGAAWDAGAATLKSSVARQQWVAGLRDMRKPFGKVATRKAEKFARAHTLPGAPDGDYALILFDTRFAQGGKAQEQVTWMLESGDTWRVSGYYIR
jgi:hypothetical protein